MLADSKIMRRFAVLKTYITWNKSVPPIADFFMPICYVFSDFAFSLFERKILYITVYPRVYVVMA